MLERFNVVNAVFAIVLAAPPADSFWMQSDEGRFGNPAECFQPKLVGPRKAAVPSWFYNYVTGQCEFFVFGGCQGNDNRFDSLALCKRTCPVQDPCKQPKYVGDCKGAFRRWYYNQTDAKCEEFDYGGCNANGNNFDSCEKCEEQCLYHSY